MRRGKDVVYLVAVKERRAMPRVYAVRAAEPEEALAIIAALASDGAEIELTGSLSGRLARALKLKPGEFRFI